MPDPLDPTTLLRDPTPRALERIAADLDALERVRSLGSVDRRYPVRLAGGFAPSDIPGEVSDG